MIDRHLEKNIQNAFVTATHLRSKFITVETLLHELLDNDRVRVVLRACDCPCLDLRDEVRAFIDKKIPKLLAGEDPRPSVGFQRVIERALQHVQSSERADRDLHGEDVLVAMFDEPDSWAVNFLARKGVTRMGVVNMICSREFVDWVQRFDPPPTGVDPDARAERVRIHDRRVKRDPFEAFTVNLNEAAKAGKIDPLIGREAEISRMVQVLCRRRKNNPILVGEAGVGKTAIAEGLALRMVTGDVPAVLKGRVLRSLNMGNLVAGTKFRGDFEERVRQLVEAVEKRPETILFIDEIHNMVGAGATSNGQTLDAADLLKPALVRGGFSCIGATTYDEYRRIFEKDTALARRFQKIDVPPATPEETLGILRGLKADFEGHYGLRYSDAALEAAVSLSDRCIPNRFLPDKAIDVVDEAGAAQLMLPAYKRRKTIGRPEIEAVVSSIARVPLETVGADETERLRDLAGRIKTRIFGQDEAVDGVVSAVKRSRAGLAGHDRPVGSFLFTGPTGVGKTELARQLAEALGLKLLRYDMSEFSETHTVSRLVGAPPGYVGYDQGGQLTEAVAKHPCSVVLLDEIEKANQQIFNVLLQVMDRGVLTDNTGREADFRNVILIMTSNAGARAAARNVIGFGESTAEGDDRAEVRRIFSPEFRNRLDAVVRFKSLSRDLIAKVADKMLSELSGRLAARGVKAEFTQALRDMLVERGYDPAMGARPMRRLIQDEIERPLAEELLFGPLAKGGGAVVGFEDGKVVVKAERPEEGGKGGSARARRRAVPA